MRETPFFPASAWLPLSPEGKGRARFFGLGEVRLAVLSLIAEEPKHGYQLMKEIGARLGPLYHASAGTVYPVLKSLEKDGLIEAWMEAGRRMYRPTKAGRKLLAAEAETIAEIWSRAEEVEDLGRQTGPHSMVVAGPLAELYTAALRAAKWSSGDPDREDQVREILRRASSSLHKLTAGKEKR
jgi:DNA-binding PadR family transcriptional regulator